jgi:serine/threonine protein kinase
MARAPDTIPGISHLEEVGRGAFSTVFKGEQIALGRTVAVKVLEALSANEANMRRFRRELLALGKLSDHPYIVPIFESGVDSDNRPFIVMAFSTFGTLSDRLRTGPLGWKDVIDLVIKLACALHAAHEAGVIHGDVKPSNVLFTKYGQPQLMDFGIARVASDQVTQTSAIGWTPAFVAPEVLAGAEPTTASDTYSLSATAYALLLGRPPFVIRSDDPIATVMKRVTDGQPPSLSDVCPGTVERILAAAISRVPDFRPERSIEFAAALRDAQLKLGVEPTPLVVPAPDASVASAQGSRRSGPTSRLRWRRAAYSPRALATVLVLGLLAGSGLAAGIGLALNLRPPPAPTAFVEKPTEAAATPDGSIVFVDLNRIWRLNPSGSLRLVGGKLESGFGGDGGPAADALFNRPTGIDVEPNGSILIADTANNRIRLIDQSGTVRTFAGNGQEGYTGDGAQATLAELGEPVDVKLGPDGYVYIADSNNTVIRRVSPSGTISTYMGSGSSAASSPDGIPALQYALQDPLSIAFDRLGQVVVLDYNTIRRVNKDLTVTTIAGNGQTGTCQDNPVALEGSFNSPINISADAAGGIYVADPGCNEIRYVTPSGALQSPYGHGQPALSADSGPASALELNQPEDVVPLASGGVVVLDSGNDRILLIRSGNVATWYRFKASSVAGIY